ncbi:39S ribosomal protein L48, mitochondrial isoform X1 [Bombus terrestris]|uniref:39S ribosomal protein L48, mitochondrial isoform X1 n=1 Tax=Bombus terrestris TaxID=30195 RepID=A0A9B0F492_BOMTE|nr:39S ribosomal protein L48, mitochondrial isoform X1 [Bombus terrestris]
MILNVLKQVTTYCRRPLFNETVRLYGIYEPPYLKQKEYEIPICPDLNIQIRGYNYPVLENYQSFVHKIAKVFNFTIDQSFPMPHREYKIKRYKKGGTIVDAVYDLKIYERDIQISDMSSIKLPILIRILEATLPEGVSLHVDKYDPLLEKKRLIPNRDLIDIKKELDELIQNKGK